MTKKEFNKLQNITFKNVIIKDNKISGSFEGEIMEKTKNEKLTLEAISNLIDQKLDPIYKILEKHSEILKKHSEILEKHDKNFNQVFDILKRNNLK